MSNFREKVNGLENRICLVPGKEGYKPCGLDITTCPEHEGSGYAVECPVNVVKNCGHYRINILTRK